MKKFILAMATLMMVSSSFAALFVDITYENPTDHFLTVNFSGSQLVTSNTNNDLWDWDPLTADLWNTLTLNEGVNLVPGTILQTYTILSGNATASVAGGDSISLDKVMFYTSGTVNNFSLSFEADPNPLFAVNDEVVFDGSAILDLGSDIASQFNIGTWSDGSNAGFTEQFEILPLELVMAQIPEPAMLSLIATFGGGPITMRRIFKT